MDYEDFMKSPILDEVWNKQKEELKRQKIFSKKNAKKEKDEVENFAKHFFKLGIINGIKFKTDLKECKSDEGFFNYEYSCFDEYLETKRIDKLRENNEYNQLRKKENELKNKYPKLTELIEDEEPISNFTEEEQKAILEMIEINGKMFNIEKKEIYLMGMKEMINILYR